MFDTMRVLSAYRRQWAVKYASAIILSIIYVVFSLCWFLLDYARLLTGNAHVFDLGASTSSLISLRYSLFSPSLIYALSPIKPFELILSLFMFIYPSPVTLLAIQDFWVPVSIFPIFYYTYQTTRVQSMGYLFVASYLLLYSLNASLLDDFHFQLLFQPFFFFAIYLFENERKLTPLFALLASMCNLLLGGIAGLYFLIELLLSTRPKREKRVKRNLAIFSLAGIIALLAFYIISPNGGFSNLIYGANYGSVSSGRNVSILSQYSENASAFVKYGLPSFLLNAAPAVFVLIVTKGKTSIFVLPLIASFVFVGVVVGLPFWHFYAQYSGDFFVPFLFLFILKSASKLYYRKTVAGDSISHQFSGSSSRKVELRRYLPKLPLKALSLFVIVFLIWNWFSPIGFANSPAVQGMGAYANIQGDIHPSANDIIGYSFHSLVPFTSSVLVEDNMPGFSDRPRNYLFGPGMLPWLNQTPGVWYDYGPTPSSPIPDYMAPQVGSAVNGAGWYFFTFYNSTSGSMATWFPFFYNSYTYGLLAVAYPYYLYERNYFGPAVISVPINVTQTGQIVNNVPLQNQNGSNENFTVLKDTSYELFLMPGTYTFRCSISEFRFDGAIKMTVSQGNIVLNTYGKSVNDSGSNFPIFLNGTFDVRSPAVYALYVSSVNSTGNLSRLNYLTMDVTRPF